MEEDDENIEIHHSLLPLLQEHLSPDTYLMFRDSSGELRKALMISLLKNRTLPDDCVKPLLVSMDRESLADIAKSIEAIPKVFEVLTDPMSAFGDELLYYVAKNAAAPMPVLKKLLKHPNISVKQGVIQTIRLVLRASGKTKITAYINPEFVHAKSLK